MVGNERVKFCGQCSLNVYNLSSMTRAEAEHLIASTEGRLCVRFYRRRDGSIITKDCPVGVRAIARRVSYFAKAVISLVLGLFAGLGVHQVFADFAPFEPQHTTGIMIRKVDPLIQDQGQLVVPEPPPVIGQIMVRKPSRHRSITR
jgi:hypothetical protein